MRIEPITSLEMLQGYLEHASDIFGSLDPLHYSAADVLLPHYYEACRHFREMVEIGTWRGLSAMIFSSWGIKVHTFDILEQEHCKPLWERFEVDVDQHVCHDRTEIAGIVETLSFDFAFIDAVHNYTGVSADFEMVKRCGNVLMHDYDEQRFPGVFQFANEIGAVPGYGAAFWTACDVPAL
jgi:hypothetical protein